MEGKTPALKQEALMPFKSTINFPPPRVLMKGCIPAEQPDYSLRTSGPVSKQRSYSLPNRRSDVFGFGAEVPAVFATALPLCRNSAPPPMDRPYGGVSVVEQYRYAVGDEYDERQALFACNQPVTLIGRRAVQNLGRWRCGKAHCVCAPALKPVFRVWCPVRRR